MKMDKKYLEHVMTSGEAAMHAINQKKFGKSFFHLGPERDISVFEKVKDNRTDLHECDFILCTGLQQIGCKSQSEKFVKCKKN